MAQVQARQSAPATAAAKAPILLVDDEEQALQSYEKAIAVNPRHNLALLNQACTLLYLERSNEALRLFDSLLELMPDYPLALHNRAIALTDLRRYQEAVASADRCSRGR